MENNLDKNLAEEVDRLVSLKGKDNWRGTRTDENFDLIQRTYSFGVRNCYKKKEQGHDSYVDLQSSRGIGIEENDNIDRIMSTIDDSLELISSDLVRIRELEYIFDNKELFPNGFNHTGLVELGFRVPRLMKYYSETYEIPAWGYDISPLSLGVTQKLNHDGRLYDFDACDQNLDLSGASLLISYHMLEHLSDPLKAVKKIYQEMDAGSYFHVEIPIEPGMPRLEFAHMFPFEPKDMGHMLTEAGFKLFSLSYQTHVGGPHIERYFAGKV